MPFVVSLVENKLPTAQASSNELHQEHCADCHGAQMEGGARGFPPLLNLAQRLAPEKIRALIANGSGRMPGFKHLGSAAVDALMDYLTTGETRRVSVDRTLRVSIQNTDMGTTNSSRILRDIPPWSRHGVRLTQSTLILEPTYGRYR